MNRKKIMKLATLCLTLILSFSSTAFASIAPSLPGAIQTKNISEFREHKGNFKGSAFKKLLDELKISKEDIKKARSSDKTLFDLAKEKGYTTEQVKDKLIKYETEAINKAVAEGRLTKEKGEEILVKVRERTATWDGSFKKFNHKHKELKLLKDLGLSKEDINEARKSGKTVFDLAKEKKSLSPQQVKDMMIKDKTEIINKKVSEGKITKEKGEEIISKIKSRIQNWDGKFKN